jgi:autotransporter-associated beta strand protein
VDHLAGRIPSKTLATAPFKVSFPPSYRVFVTKGFLTRTVSSEFMQTSPFSSFRNRFRRAFPACLLLTWFSVSGARAQAPPATFSRVISTSSQSLTVDFSLHPIRSTNFSVLVQQADGSFSTHTPDVARTYLGTVQGRPGAIACGLLRANGTLLARISFEDGTTWTTTGGTASSSGSGFTPAWPTSVVGSGGAGSAVYAAEYGFDSTFNHFTACGGTADAVLEQCEFSTMSANMVYLRDAAILHRIGKIIVRADQTQDPYVPDGGDTGLLLPRVRTIWNTSTPMGSTHDLAAVLHSAAGGGLAYVGTVGTSSRYSANDSEANGDFSVVWRHEAGHNWGSSHYEGGGNPEGSTIMSNNSLSRFSSSELAKIIAHRKSKVSVLDNLGAYTFPLPPRANQDTFSYLVTGSNKIDPVANDSDSNGESLSLHSFDGFSAFGGTLTRSVGTGPGGRDEILYTPPAVLTPGADWFKYRIQDAAGMQAVGYAMLRPTTEIVTPVDHWTLDDASGTTAVNRIRTAQNGTHQNGASPNQTGANAVTRKGVRFDGVDDQTSIPAPGYNTNTLTFTAWVKRDGTQASYAPLVFTRAGSSIAGLHFGTANELRYTWDSGGYTWNSGITVPDDTWCLAAMCVSSSGTTLHLRTPTGLQSATNTATQAAEAFNGTMYLGYDSNSSTRRLKGWLDDVRVYKSTLTSAQIESLYQQSLNPPGVQLTSPANGTSISPLNVQLAASVNTLASITSRVDFVENETSLASAATLPWSALLSSLSTGAHTLTARAGYGDWGYQIDSAPVSFTTLAAPLPSVTVTASLPASKRGPNPGYFIFTRSHSIGAITVPFTTSGTAVAGTDYTAISNSVTFPDGSLTQSLTVDPIAAAPDSVSETLIVTLSSGSGYAVGAPSSATLTIDDHITSIAAGEWDVGATWNSGNPAPTSGTQNSGDPYAVAHTVTSNDSNSNSQALVAKSLRVKSGGVLDLARLHATTNQNVSYNLPATSVENGGTIQCRCSTGSSTHTVSAAISVAGNTTFKFNGGSYENDANLTGTISGTGTIAVLSDTSAGSTTSVRQLSVNKSGNPYQGNWTVNHTGGGDDFAALRAGAANALGTGTVTVGTRSQLINDNATGLNSLSGIVLTGVNSSLLLNQPWTNTAAGLSLTGGSPLVQLGNAASSIGDLSGQFGVIQGTGTSSALTVNQTTDRVFSADLGANLKFTKSGPASLTLAGSLDPSLAVTLANGSLAFAGSPVISSLTQSGGVFRISLPASPATVPLTVSGNHARTGGTIVVDVTGVPQADVSYPLLRYQGALTGTPSVTVNDTSGSGLVAAVSNGTGSDSAITVVFSTPPPPQYALTYTASAGGSISGQTPQSVIQGNNGEPVTAVPDVGYSFDQWSDGNTNATRAENNVSADLSVQALFTLNQYPVTYTAGANGSISGTATQSVPHGGNAQTVTAVPDSGAIFIQWSDGVTTAQRTDTNVTGPLSLTAQFLSGNGPVSIATGAWSSAATWNHGLPAPVSGTQGSGFQYLVQGFTVTSNDPASNTQAMIGASLAVGNGGVLDLARTHSLTLQTVSHNLPPISLGAGATLKFRASNGSSNHVVSAPLSVNGDATLRISGGNYANEAALTGLLSGPGNLDVVSESNAASTPANVRQVTVSSANNPFGGNWNVSHTAGGDDFAGLRANAANALGTGTVTLGARARLINNAPGGIDSLAGVVLSGADAKLVLTHPWSNPAATLSLVSGTSAVEVGAAVSSIGNLSGTSGSITGTDSASKLVVTQSADADFSGVLTGSLSFEKSGPANLGLGGNNLHTGETLVSAGTLSGTGSSGSALTVADGAVLDVGTGQFMASGATFQGGSRFSVTLDTDLLISGKLSASSAVVFASNVDLQLDLSGSGLVPVGTKFVIVDYTGGSLTGAFDGLADGASIVLGANLCVLSYSDNSRITLTTVAPQTPYESWTDASGLDGSNGKDPAFAADPDHDGIANGLEWVLGGNPLASDGASLIQSVVTPAGGLVLHFNRSEGSIGEVSVLVETSVDLTNTWSPFAAIAAEGSGPVVIDTVPDPDAVTVTIPASQAANGRLFARIKVSEP